MASYPHQLGLFIQEVERQLAQSERSMLTIIGDGKVHIDGFSSLFRVTYTHPGGPLSKAVPQVRWAREADFKSFCDHFTQKRHVIHVFGHMRLKIGTRPLPADSKEALRFGFYPKFGT